MMAWLMVNTFVLLTLTTAFCHCKPYGLSVSDVTATSVVLHWHSTETTVEEFKIWCTGTHQYETEGGEQVTDLVTAMQYAPKGSDHVLIGDMEANVNYSCTVTEDIDVDSQILGTRASDPHWFTTDYGAPEQPRSPVVHTKDNIVTIELFPTSTKFGPIHGYEVQFHLFNGWSSDGLPFIDPGDTLVGKLVSMDESQKSIDPMAFEISYNSTSLPESITINNDLLNGALKNGVMYTVITVAYTTVEENNNGSTVLSTESIPSTTFTAIGLAAPSSSSLENGSATQLILAIGLGVAFPLVVLGYFLCVGAFIYCREMRLRKQKAYTRSDIINARRTQQQDNSSWIQAATEGDLPWLDPLEGSSKQQIPLLENPQQNHQSTLSLIAEVHESAEAGVESVNHVSGTCQQETIIIIENEAFESGSNKDSNESQSIALTIEPECTCAMMDESTAENTSIQGISAGEELSSVYIHESMSSNLPSEEQNHMLTDDLNSSSQQSICDEQTDSSIFHYKANPVIQTISPDSTSVSSMFAESQNEHSVHSNLYSSICAPASDPSFTDTAELSTLILMSSKSSMSVTNNTTPSVVSSETTIFSRLNPAIVEPQSKDAMYCILSTDCCIHGPIISVSSMSQSNGSVQRLSSCPDCSQHDMMVNTKETQCSLATSSSHSSSQQDSLKLSSSGGSSSILFKPSLFNSAPNSSKVSWSHSIDSNNTKTSLTSSVSEHNLSPPTIDTINSESAKQTIASSSCSLSPDSSTIMLNHNDSNGNPCVEENLSNSKQFTDSLKLEMSLSKSQHDESTISQPFKSGDSVLSQHSSTDSPFLRERKSRSMSNPSVFSIKSSSSGLSHSTSEDYHSAMECSEKPHCLCGTIHEHGTTDSCIVHDETSNYSLNADNIHLTSSSDSLFIPRLLSCKSLDRAADMVLHVPDTSSSASLLSFQDTVEESESDYLDLV